MITIKCITYTFSWFLEIVQLVHFWAFLIFLRFTPLLDKISSSKHAIDHSEYVSQNLLDQHKSSKIHMQATTLKHLQNYINGFQHCHTDIGVTEKYDLGRARQSTFTHTRKCTAFTVSAVKKKCAACLFSMILIKCTTYTFLLKMCCLYIFRDNN
mgnify:CR=1 FL=1